MADQRASSTRSLSSVWSSSDDEDEDLFEETWLDRYGEWVAGLIVIVWILIGVVAGVGIQGWDYATSFYVIVQICTTVGYGDKPMSTSLHIFMVFYIIIGTMVAAAVISEIVDTVLKWGADNQKALFKTALRKDSQPHDQVANPMRHLRHQGAETLLSLGVLAFMLLVWATFFSVFEQCTCSYDKDEIDGCDATTLESCIETNGKQLTFTEALYFGIVTYSTVGFGDYTPQTWEGRIFSCFGMLLGVGSFCNFVKDTSKFFTCLKAFMRRPKKLSLKLFHKLDSDKSNYITRADFRIFFLLSHGVIKEEQLIFVDHMFDSYDSNKDGLLQVQEVEDMLREEAEDTEDEEKEMMSQQDNHKNKPHTAYQARTIQVP